MLWPLSPYKNDIEKLNFRLQNVKHVSRFAFTRGSAEIMLTPFKPFRFPHDSVADVQTVRRHWKTFLMHQYINYSTFFEYSNILSYLLTKQTISLIILIIIRASQEFYTYKSELNHRRDAFWVLFLFAFLAIVFLWWANKWLPALLMAPLTINHRGTDCMHAHNYWNLMANLRDTYDDLNELIPK